MFFFVLFKYKKMEKNMKVLKKIKKNIKIYKRNM